jgi:hypothetical protein
MDRRNADEGVVVELHGWLSEEVLSEFEKLCGSLDRPLLLDLTNLAGAGEAGLLALRRRVAAGARLEGVSPYIRLLLESLDEPRP